MRVPGDRLGPRVREPQDRQEGVPAACEPLAPHPEAGFADAQAKAEIIEARLAKNTGPILVRTVADLGQRAIADMERRMGLVGRQHLAETYGRDRQGIIRNWICNPDVGLGHLRLQDWTKEECSNFIERLDDSGAIGDKRIETIGNTVNYLIRVGHEIGAVPYGTNPMDGVWFRARPFENDRHAETVEAHRIASIEQCEVIEAGMFDVTGELWSVLLRQTRDTMTRWGEVIALTPADFTFDRPATAEDVRKGKALAVGDPVAVNSVRIWRSIQECGRGENRFKLKITKGCRRRTARFTPEVAAVLRPIVEAAEQRGGPHWRVFARPGGEGRTLAPSTARVLEFAGLTDSLTRQPLDGIEAFFSDGVPDRKWWTRQLDQAAAKGDLLNSKGHSQFTTHAWRHRGAATWLYDRRVSEPLVMQMGGWADITTMKNMYASGADDRDRDELDALCGAFG